MPTCTHKRFRSLDSIDYKKLPSDTSFRFRCLDCGKHLALEETPGWDEVKAANDQPGTGLHRGR